MLRMLVYEVYCATADWPGEGTVKVYRGAAESEDAAKLKAMGLMPRGMGVVSVVCRWPLDW